MIDREYAEHLLQSFRDSGDWIATRPHVLKKVFDNWFSHAPAFQQDIALADLYLMLDAGEYRTHRQSAARWHTTEAIARKLYTRIGLLKQKPKNAQKRPFEHLDNDGHTMDTMSAQDGHNNRLNPLKNSPSGHSADTGSTHDGHCRPLYPVRVRLQTQTQM